MGLQIRLRHPLGQRMVDVPRRGADRPVVVGRSASADVQVPSTLVGPTHCIIFEQDGQWVLEDVEGTTGTLVNGQQIAEAVAIGSGDVVQLGLAPGAPTFEVDPLRLAGGGVPMANAARPQTPAAYALPATPAAASYPADDQQVDMSGTAASIGGAGPGGTPAYQRYYVPHQRTPTGAIVACVIIGIVVVGAVAAVFWARSEPPAPPVAQKPVTPLAPAPPVAVVPPRPRPVRPAPAGEAIKPTTDNPAPDEPANDVKPTPTDPLKATESWQAVEEAAQPYFDPVQAIIRFERYRNDNPKLFEAELAKYTEDALDRLWWDRIKQVMAARDEKQAKIDEIDDLIRQEPDPQFKQDKLPERAALAEARDALKRELNQYGYTGTQPPKAGDAEAMQQLRAGRDPKFYAKWKAAVLDSFKRKGKPPWGATM